MEVYYDSVIFTASLPFAIVKLFICSRMEVPCIWFFVLIISVKRKCRILLAESSPCKIMHVAILCGCCTLTLCLLSHSATRAREIFAAPGKPCRWAFKFTAFHDIFVSLKEKLCLLALARHFMTHINFKKPNGKIDRMRAQVDKLANKVSDLTVTHKADLLKLHFL